MAGKKKSKKQKGGGKGNKLSSLLQETRGPDPDAIALIPTQRITPKIPIPRQMELVKTYGCSSAGGVRCRRRLMSLHQSKYHPWSTTRKCARPGLLSAVAWNPTRIRNTILAVGPGTPAHVLWYQRHGNEEFERERLSAFDRQFDRRGMMDDDSSLAPSDMEDEDFAEGSEDDSDDNEEIPEASAISTNAPQRPQPQVATTQQLEQPTTVNWLPSMRHGSSLNTASWLNCPWRLSRADGGMSLSSGDNAVLPNGMVSCYEMPTQVMTSGDDCIIKIWDLSNAMGSANLLPGGWDSFSPLTMTNIKELGSDDQNESWKKYYEERDGVCKVAGSVRLLASMHSKHRGNVVHASPIADAPGKVLSCGVDGFLRVSDLESGSSTVVIDPHIHDDFDESFTDMAGGGFGVSAFSHLSLTGNTGLLCCQRGLFRFDIRVAPNLQPRTSLLDSLAPGASRSLACRACAVWSPCYYRSDDSYPQYMNAQSEPSYIFVGGDSDKVELLDLRMLGGSSSQQQSTIQRYCPVAFSNGSNASVSSIDVSKDGRELLVSYENDQIYTFPVCCKVTNYLAGPSEEELALICRIYRATDSSVVPQLAIYGGHLNRRTYLNKVSFAGPNDEYILSGSDSGQAFIFDRSTTCVAALLNADSTTCNGIVAHPTLPFFVTYGIDASAKLWRACASQDSPAARAKASIEMPDYKLSSVTRQWSRVQASLHRFIEKAVPLVLPDSIASDEVFSFSSGLDPDMMDLVSGSIMGTPRAEYGNALRCLSPLLRQTKYRCYRAVRDFHHPPICSTMSCHAAIVAWNRLRLQATSIGMDVNPWAPWVFENKNSFHRIEDTFGFHKADLVPDNPSDWIFFDPQCVFRIVANFHCLFHVEGRLEVLRRNFPDNPLFFGAKDTMFENFTAEFANTNIRLPWISDERWNHQFEIFSDVKKTLEQKERWGIAIVEETISVLKEGGNEAMKLGLIHKAAQRYDKGIQYCAITMLEHPMAIPEHPSAHSIALRFLSRDRSIPTSFLGPRIGYDSVICKEGNSPHIYWTSILQNLIALRLNLSLLLLKPEFGSPSLALEQAREALKLVTPFATKPCMVVGEGFLLDGDGMREFGKPEPISSFRQAKPVQAKAYYRLGCAYLDLKKYRKAVKTFRLSLECSQQAKCDKWGKALGTVKPNPQVLQRIEEAEAKLKEGKASK